ncbi:MULTISPECIES: TetR family transcriptional regulator [unclassified Streptomyces]|uniref:TetR family transcriptional regulator n=1 Tax=unclassified Streptomyces TaxID=2593676 RepID=UPI002ED240C3|nr:TetR family transcriptional regulator [Streptomyces sp. NBC_00891]WSY05288.1 TetR family transcriptional regulator [Streptomyces sp. NBC_00890]WSZ06912.1 TetR family transcriptional regulator [Streptomyces sp. NBC_00869]WSZ25590.1 TetR family transcriptional regulator [Streptomyces sp. NBC_00870]
MTEGQPSAALPTGLRERKKRRTRDALLVAALELFTAHGYEETTVDEIADAVEVSQRTFFRYFAGKEAAVFAVQDMVESHFLSELRQRPADEAPFEAMRRAVLCAWDSIGQTVEAIIPVELHMRAYRMIESTPSLLAAHLRRSIVLEDRITELIAGREGLDLARDPRPRVAVAAFSGVMRAAGQLWGQRGDGGIESLRALTETYLDALTPALSERWRTP